MKHLKNIMYAAVVTIPLLLTTNIALASDMEHSDMRETPNTDLTQRVMQLENQAAELKKTHQEDSKLLKEMQSHHGEGVNHLHEDIFPESGQ